MKVQLITPIGDKRIIRAIEDAAYDLEATRKQIAPMITPGMTKQQIDQLFMNNMVYGKTGDEGELIDDTAANALREKLNARGPHRALLDTGEYIDDYRGVAYWIQESGQWLQGTVEQIGIPLPAGAVLPNELTPEQRQEIAGQQEAERRAALTPEEKAAELQARLDAVADEAARLEKRDQIQRQAEKNSGQSGMLATKPVFDAADWYSQRKSEIEAQYA